MAKEVALHHHVQAIEAQATEAQATEDIVAMGAQVQLPLDIHTPQEVDGVQEADTMAQIIIMADQVLSYLGERHTIITPLLKS